VCALCVQTAMCVLMYAACTFPSVLLVHVQRPSFIIMCMHFYLDFLIELVFIDIAYASKEAATRYQRVELLLQQQRCCVEVQGHCYSF
jgi:hypothetical protein